MSLEDITAGHTIANLITTNPASGDSPSQGDDHIRNLKKAITYTFPNLSATTSGVAAELAFAHKGGTVSGNAVILGTLRGDSTLSVSGAAVVHGALQANSTFSASGAAYFSGALVANSNVIINGAVQVNSLVTISGVAIINGTLQVNGTITAQGALQANSTLSVSGAAVLNNVTINGNLTVSGTIISTYVPRGYARCVGGVGPTFAVQKGNVSTISRSATGIYALTLTASASTYANLFITPVDTTARIASQISGASLIRLKMFFSDAAGVGADPASFNVLVYSD